MSAARCSLRIHNVALCLCIGDTPHRFTSCPIALTLSSGAPVASVWDIFSNVIATFLTRQSCYLPFVRVYIHQLGQRRHCQGRDLFWRVAAYDIESGCFFRECLLGERHLYACTRRSHQCGISSGPFPILTDGRFQLQFFSAMSSRSSKRKRTLRRCGIDGSPNSR